MSVQPSQGELGDLSLACQKLWELDENRLQPERDYAIDLQLGKKSYEDRDVAQRPLFKFVAPEVFSRRTYKLFYDLLDNYQTQTGFAERMTQEQAAEVVAFLDALMQTRVMQYAFKYIAARGAGPNDERAFKAMLHQMWFSLYRREVQDDSSGFEHVFVGESDKGRISGFHNWLQFHLQEKAGHLNYTGYILPRRRGAGQEAQGGDERLVSVQFGWGGEVKDVSSIFIGTSPEFEVALYTLCWACGGEENMVQVGDYLVKLRCYRIRSKYGDKVGSAFPELVEKVEGRPARPPAQQNGYQQPPQAAAPIPGATWQQAAPPPRPGNYAAAAQPAFVEQPTYPVNQQQQQPFQVQQQQQQGYAKPPAGYPGAPGQQPQQQQQGQGQQQHAQGGQPGQANQGCGNLVEILISLGRALLNRRQRY